MNRTDFQRLAELRIQEAEALLEGTTSFPDGAFYLAGYAVECALKACIAKMVNQYDFPDKSLANRVFTHDLESLRKIAGLPIPDNQEMLEKLQLNWAVVKDWSEEMRYRNDITESQAASFIEAITNSESGVFPWIKAHW